MCIYYIQAAGDYVSKKKYIQANWCNHRSNYVSFYLFLFVFVFVCFYLFLLTGNILVILNIDQEKYVPYYDKRI